MITEIRLKNFRSHLDSHLKFSQGTNALVGILGSGKSSVMNALCFALFGTFPDLQTKRIKLDDIIMNKPFVKDRAEVEVSFEIDGKKYSVVRIIERGKGTVYSEIREDGKLLEAPNSQRVTKLVEKILKVNYELFSKAIYSEQNALDYFLTLPRGERMRRIDSLLMIDKFEKARASTVTVRNRLMERKLGKQSIVDQIDVEELKKNLDSVSTELKKLEEERENISREIKSLTERKVKVEKRLEELEGLNKLLTSLREEEKSLKSAIEENEKVLSEIKTLLKERKPEELKEEFEKIKKKLENLEEELTKKRDELESLTRLNSEIKTKIEILEEEKLKELEEKKKKKEDSKRDLEEMKKEYGEKPEETLDQLKRIIEELEREKASISARLKDTEYTLNQIVEVKDKCPVCHSKISETKREQLIKEHEKKIEKYKEDLKIIEEKLTKEKEKLKDIEIIVEKYKQLVDEVSDLEKITEELEKAKLDLEKLRKELDDSDQKISKIKEEIEELKEELEKEREKKTNLESLLSKFAELERIQERLKELKEKESGVKKRMEEVSKEIGEEDIEVLRKNYTELVRKLSELQERQKNLEELAKEKENRMKEYEEKLKNVEKEKEEIAKLDKIIKDLKVFERALELTQTQLRKNFIDAVNYTMNKLWPSLYPYGDFTEIALNIQEGDYVLQLKDRMGRWINVDGMASGGERSLACLALRIAFSLVLAPHLRILILDEPTANLDTNAIAELATTLRERIGEFIDQTFLITHSRELEDAVTGNAYRVERDKSTDGVTRVTAI